MMYASYLIFDIVSLIVENKTYINEYMIQQEKYQKIEDQLMVTEKLKVYASMNEADNKNKIK